MKSTPAFVALAALALAVPAAGHKLIPAGARVPVAKSTLTVQAAGEWNRLGRQPGPQAEDWTLDGEALNDVRFYAVAAGQPLLREADRKVRPLPRFDATMLLTDVPALVEASYRIALDTPLMTIEKVEPATFAGRKAVRFRYLFTRPNEEVQRHGEAFATIVDERLYMASYEAPTIYYFDRDLERYRTIVASATLG